MLTSKSFRVSTKGISRLLPVYVSVLGDIPLDIIGVGNLI